MRTKFLYIIPIILIFFLISCVSTEEEPENHSPIANAGEDLCCRCGETFTLNADGSEDPDGDSLEYKWTIGDDVYFGKELSGSFGSEGVYAAYLEVSDGLATDIDSIVITVEPKEETIEEEAVKEEEEENQEEQQVTYGINIVSLTSPISRGSQASITINTAPNVLCTITVYYKSGPSKAQGLDPKNSDSNGNCTWSWKVGTGTTPGNWRIVLTAEGVGRTETTFTVTADE